LIGIGATIALSGPFVWIVRERWFHWKKQISWRQFYSKLSAPRVRVAIELNGRKPDMIIGVNSGIVPAAILTYNYQIEKLIYVSSMPGYDARGHRMSCDVSLADLNIAGKYVLIVDDQYYSGDTMRAVRDEVVKLPGADQATVYTFAVFAYDTPARPLVLDVAPLGRVNGVLARVPWAFSPEIERHYWERNRKEQPNP
jgi:hypoxanthine phosphoribosyltransferase